MIEEKLSKKEIKDLGKSLKESKEGRTYLFCCGKNSKKSKVCSKSKLPLDICYECCSKESKK